MPLKGYLLYYALPILFYILSRMIHPVFYLFILIYLIYILIYKRNLFFYILLILSISLCLFKIPASYNGTTIKGKVCLIQDNGIVVSQGYYKVLVYGDFKDVQMYDEIELEGNIYDLLPPTNQYGFNYKRYLYSKNIFQVLTHIQTINHTHTKHPYHYIEKKINENDKLKGILSLFILGIKDESIEEDYTQLANLSLVHLFALSGMHIDLLKKWLKNILGLFISSKYLEICTIIIIGIYLMIIPYNISFLRAYLMMVLMFFFKKHISQLELFIMLTLAMLFYNPYLIFNMSFIFSYTIYFFVIILQNHKYSKYFIFLSTIPLVLLMNYRIPLYSLISGILLMPVVEILYQAILYFFILGKLVAPIVGCIYDMFMMMVDFIAYYNIYLYFPRVNLLFITVYYYLYIQAIYMLTLNRRCTKQLLCILSLLIAFYFYPYYSMKSQVVMIDVGQGDCFLIQQAYHKGNILIDTGGMKNKDVAVDIIIPFLYSQGIQELDAVFISHEDFDHCGALESLQNNFKVKEVIRDFKEKTIGDITFKNLSIKTYDDENDNSLVIYTTINHLNYLFTGDISVNVEKDLYEKYKSLDVDVLKVGHHGSNTSSSIELFKMIKPKIALIGVGRKNMYHHPSLDIIERLKSYGISIYRSDEDGMVKIVGYGNYNYIYKTLGDSHE